MPPVAALTAALLAALALACADPPDTSEPYYCPGPGFRCPCASTFGCPGGEVCEANVCVPPSADAGDDLGEDPVDDADAGTDGGADIGADVVEDADDAGGEVDTGSDAQPDAEPDGSSDVGPDAPTCADDRFDERVGPVDDTNDRATAAVPLAEGVTAELIACPGDPDWFSVDPEEHTAIRVDVYTDADLDVRLWNRAGTQERAVAIPFEGGLRLTYETVTSTPFAVSIEGAEEAVEYELDYEATRVACADDAADGGGGDDVREDATPVVSGSVVAAVLCDTDDAERDWYALDVLAGHVVSATLSFRDYDPSLSGTTLALQLFRGSDAGALLSPVASGAETSIETGVLVAGRYYLAVRSVVSGEGAYDLRVLIEPSATCDFDTVHEDDATELLAAEVPLTFAPDGSVATDLNGLVLCEDDSADVFAFPLDANQRVTIEVELNDGAADLRVQAYGEGQSPSSVPLVERDGDVYRTSYSSSQDGLHYVRIEQGAVLRRTFYELRIQRAACVFDDYERNDTAAEAHLITQRSFEDLAVDFCEGDQVDWYRREAFAHRSHAVRVENVGDEDIAYALFRASQAMPDAWCDEDTECDPGERCLGQRGCAEPLAPGWVEVAPGDAERRSFDPGDDPGLYYLAVESLSPGAVGSYSLRWTDEPAVCPPSAADNHSSDDARALDPATVFPVQGSLCRASAGSPRDDYYELELAANTRAAVFVSAAAGDLVEVRDCADPTEVLASSTTGALVYVATSAAAPELACFLLRGTAARAGQGAHLVDYSLTVGFSDADAECGDDSAEPNNTDDTATPLAAGLVRHGSVLYAGGGRSVCVGDRDAYSLTLGAGDRVRASVFHDALVGDLSIELRGPCLASCPALASAATSASPEVLEHVVEDAGRYVLAVQRSSGAAHQRYDLAVEVDSGCEPDPFEVNDQPVLATDFGELGSEALNLCAVEPEQPDVDWYSTYLAVGDTLTANAFFDVAHGNIDLYVLHDGAIVTQATGSTGVEAVSHVATVAGTYQLGVAARGGRDTTYRLIFDIDTAPCADDAFEENDGKAQAVRVIPGYYDGLVQCPRNEDWYAFEVSAPSLVHIAVTSEPAVETDDFLVEVYQPSVLNPDGLLWLVSTPGREPDVLEGFSPVGAAGTYYVRVRQRPGSVNSGPIPYDLALGVAPQGECPADRFEPNQDIASAPRVDGLGEWTASACDVDWYELTLFAGQDVSVRLGGAEPRPTVALHDEAGRALTAAGESIFARASTSGRHFLRVAPAPAADPPQQYEVSVSLGAASDVCSSEDPGEDDDNRGTAIRLRDTVFGQLCDANDFHRLTPGDGEDVAFDIVYDATRGQPTVDIVGASSDVLASAMPAGPGFMAGSFVWDDAPNAYLQVRRTDYTGPYRLSSVAYGVCTAETAGERNDTIGAATEIGTSPRLEAICHAGDRDFFEPAGAMGTRIRGLVEVLSGDVEVTLYDPVGEAVMVSNGGGADRPKEVVWADTSGGGVYRLGVRSVAEAPASYRVRLLPASPSACVDSGGNRTYDSAFPLELGEFTGPLVCAGEGDWYLTPSIPVGRTLRVTVGHDSDLADLDVELYRTEADVVAASRTLADDEIVEHTQTSTGPLRVRVFVDDGSPGTFYTLTLEQL